MASNRRLYVGPSLRRLRRDRGLTQADMAADLEVSPSYIALLERNHRPLTAEVLLRLAQTYSLDLSALTGDGASDEVARLQAALKDPIFADIDLPSLETSDIGTNFPGITEAFLRLYTTYQEEQLALADRGAEGDAGGDTDADPVADLGRIWSIYPPQQLPIAGRRRRAAGPERRRPRQPRRLLQSPTWPACAPGAGAGDGRLGPPPRPPPPGDPARR